MSKAEGTSLTERQRYWLEHVQACEASSRAEIARAQWSAERNLVSLGQWELACDVSF